MSNRHAALANRYMRHSDNSKRWFGNGCSLDELQVSVCTQAAATNHFHISLHSCSSSRLLGMSSRPPSSRQASTLSNAPHGCSTPRCAIFLAPLHPRIRAHSRVPCGDPGMQSLASWCVRPPCTGPPLTRARAQGIAIALIVPLWIAYYQSVSAWYVLHD